MRFQSRVTFAFATCAILILSACAPTPESWRWPIPAGMPTPIVPADNPMTAAKVALGRRLFYDSALSGNATQSCATCHAPALAFTDGRRRATGSTGDAHPRNAQPLANAAFNQYLNWADPDTRGIEEQLMTPMFGEAPVEMGLRGHEAEALARLRTTPGYPALFDSAFPQANPALTLDSARYAIAAFTRSLISLGSDFDRGMLSPQAARGRALFESARLGCSACHGGPFFNQPRSEATASHPFFNTGLFTLDVAGAYPTGNAGVFERTGRAQDMGAFRVPTLRNIALTAPYMHDGSVATLEEVVAIYARGGRLIPDGPLASDGARNPHKDPRIHGFAITDGETRDLIAFLNGLSDEAFVRDPRIGDPLAPLP